MNVTRFVQVLAVKTRNNILIPVWNDNIQFNKSDDYGEFITVKGDYDKHGNLVDCIYDLKNHTLSMGVDLNYYPPETECKIGETIYYDNGHKKLSEVTVVDIEYNNFDVTIKKGKNIDDWWLRRLKLESVDKNTIYALKEWKPCYILNNGVKTEYTFNMYHKI